MYTSLERLHIRDGFETSYLRHVYKCMNAAVTSHLTFVTFYVKRCRLTFSVHNTVLWYPRHFFLPDKFLFSSAAYVRRYIAWAMKVDVIMLTDFLNCWKQSRHKHVLLLSNLLFLAFTFGREKTDDEFCQ